MIARFALIGSGTIALAAAAGAQLPFSRSVSVESQAQTDTVWTIESGSYAGLRIPLHIDDALGAHRSGDHFWRVAGARGFSGGIVGWKSNCRCQGGCHGEALSGYVDGTRT